MQIDNRLFVRTARLKVKPESYAWLNAAAIEVNQVWNWANATSVDAADRNRRMNPKWLSGFDLCKLASGASQYFGHIGSDTIQRVCSELAAKRRIAKLRKLRWRISHGTRRSLGWVPFKAHRFRRKGNSVRFCGKSFRVFDIERLDGKKFMDGSFSQDSFGDWWLCIPVESPIEQKAAIKTSVGIDLGLKAIATTSDGDKLEAGQFYRGLEQQIAQAQRRGHKRQAKRLHRKAANRRKDALHKFSTRIVSEYQNIIVGDVSSAKLVKTRMAKSVLDSSWSALKTQLQYKGQQAGRCVQIVSENYTSVTCSSCGSLSGPRGVNGLTVRRWDCGDCGESHDRDVNAARNILRRAEIPASVSGNELAHAA